MVVTLAATSIATLGIVVYSGLLDRAVGSYLRGHPDPPMGQVVRQLPYGRLFGAEIILLVVASAAAMFLLLPGLFLFTLFGLVGPLITIEGHGVLPAFRCSSRLV